MNKENMNKEKTTTQFNEEGLRDIYKWIWGKEKAEKFLKEMKERGLTYEEIKNE